MNICPEAAEHTPEPNGYLGWHDWAEVMSRTHKQRVCPCCGLYKIWEPTAPTCALPPWERGCTAIRKVVV